MKKELCLSILALALLALVSASPLMAVIPPCGEDVRCEEFPEEPGGNSCSPDPCDNGYCSSTGMGFTCNCFSGWTGTYCSNPVSSATHDGMTWTLIQQYSGVTHVGADSATNAYYGDTAASTSLPILCIYQNGSPVPSWLTPNFYNGWSKGHLALTYSVAGTSLTSLAVADGYCSGYLGAGWRMAEFHDGWYGPGLASQGGWSYLGFGTIPSSTRFWVYINDQPANPWN